MVYFSKIIDRINEIPPTGSEWPCLTMTLKVLPKVQSLLTIIKKSKSDNFFEEWFWNVANKSSLIIRFGDQPLAILFDKISFSFQSEHVLNFVIKRAIS